MSALDRAELRRKERLEREQGLQELSRRRADTKVEDSQV